MDKLVSKMISTNIQELRRKRKLTLDQLSVLCGVSKAMISQIETGKTNPTVATLWKISKGLGVEINTLLKGLGGIERKFHVQRNGDHPILNTDEEGIHIKVLSTLDMVEDLEIYMLTMEKGSFLRSAPHFAGTEEYLTVIKGDVKVKAGKNISVLKEGDFIAYHCDVEHDVENISDSESVVHMVVRFQKSEK